MDILKKILEAILAMVVPPSKRELPEPELSKPNETSYRMTFTEIEAKEDEEEHKNHILLKGGRKVPIKWDKVKLYTEPDGYKIPERNYKKRKSGKPRMFVIHWDACLSSKSMVKVLENRGLSVQFAIDNDGTIFQLMPADEVAWHAKGVNSVSCGVEMANAVHMRYNKWYEKHGFERRRVKVGEEIHGKQIQPHLDFYPEQIEALKALIVAVSKAFGIPLAAPLDRNGKLVKGVHPRVAKGRFRGVVGHYHVSNNKIDPGSLDIKEIVEEVKNEN